MPDPAPMVQGAVEGRMGEPPPRREVVDVKLPEDNMTPAGAGGEGGGGRRAVVDARCCIW